MIASSNNNEFKGYLLVFIGGILWGTIGPFIRIMEYNNSSSSLTSFLRMAFAFVILVVITIAKYGFRSLKIDKKSLLFCAILGLICHGIYNIFYSISVTLTGVTISAVLLNVAPVFTAMMSSLLFKEKITKVKAIALVINILGCILAATGGKIDASMLSITGILCGLGAGFCYSMTAIVGRFLGEKSNAFVISTYSYMFAAIFLLIFTNPCETPAVLNIYVLTTGFFYALIPTAIAYIFYYQGVQLIAEISRVPIIASVETVIAGIIGLTAFREKMSTMSLLGILLVMTSIGLMNSKATTRKDNKYI